MSDTAADDRRSSVRAVNESIRDMAEANGQREFACECGDPECEAPVRMSVEEFDEVRRGVGRFLVHRDHAVPDGARRVRANDRFAVVERIPASHGAREPLRVRLSEERHAVVLARELDDVEGLDVQRRDGNWEVTVDGSRGDRLIVRVLNAVSAALAGEPTATALVLLDGREYRLGG
jgi:hypothetical protein